MAMASQLYHVMLHIQLLIEMLMIVFMMTVVDVALWKTASHVMNHRNGYI